MSIPSLTQSGQGSTSSAAPASYTQNLTQASAPGSLLLASIAAATSGAAAYTMPAGWVVVSSVAATGIDVRIYAYVNNPGAVSTIALTSMSNVNGLVVGFAEFAGMNTTTPNDQSSKVANASGTTIAPASLIAVYGNEVWYGALGWLTGGGGLTAANVGTWTAIGTASSTVGATNATLKHSYALPGPVTATLQHAGTIGVSAANAGAQASFLSTSSAAVVVAGTPTGYLVSGGAGYAVGI